MEVQMATRKKAKPVKAKQTPKPKADAPEVRVPQPEKTESKPQAPAKRKQRLARRRRRTKPTSRKREAPKRPIRPPKAAQRRRRGRYSNAERARILKTATAQKLTAQQVNAKFGVKPLTYYSWRKKAKATSRRAPQRAVAGRPELASLVRERVQERLRKMLPEIVKSEVATYLERTFRKGR
jgi:transposase-like protein